MRPPPILTVPFLALLAAPAHAQDWARIEQDVAALVERWGVPGAVVGVVRGGERPWQAGYGVRRAGGDEPVDGRTLFDIGSISKGFTAVALMTLVEDGRVDLDAPARGYLPGFRFPSDALDERVTLRDMLAHRTGIAPDNVMFWNNSLARAEVLERARFLPVSAPLGSAFQYNNIMYLAAGEALGAVAGAGWNAYVEEHLFAPLGMDRTRPTRGAVGDLENLAHPHENTPSGWRPMPFIDLDNCAPAGSIVSCLDDMLTWADMLLAQGSLGGVDVLDVESLAELWSPRIAIAPGDVYRRMTPLSRDPAYGLGFLVHDYDGLFVAEHGGQTDGMHAELFLLPDEELGIVVLTNGLNVFLPHAIVYRIVDEIFERPLEPAQEAFWAGWQQMGPSMTALPFTLPGGARALDEDSLERLPGTYTSGLYGPATVRAVDGELWLELLDRDVRLHHTGGSAFVPDWGDDSFMALSVPRVTLGRAGPTGADRLVVGGVSFARAP